MILHLERRPDIGSSFETLNQCYVLEVNGGRNYRVVLMRNDTQLPFTKDNVSKLLDQLK